jgi:O-antigen ligase
MVGGALSFGTIADRFYQRAVLTQTYDVGAGGRFERQERVLTEVATNPIGIGPGRSDDEFGLEPHNLFLHVLVEGGWLGGLGFITFLGLTLVGLARVTSRRSPLGRQATVVMSALCGMLVQTPFIDTTHWRHMWLLLALSAALTIAIRRDNRSAFGLQSATIR